MRTLGILPAAALLAAGALMGARSSPAGFPATDDVQRLYDEADLDRAVQAYRFFYSTVSGAAIYKGNRPGLGTHMRHARCSREREALTACPVT
jgi:hypothetical protein